MTWRPISVSIFVLLVLTSATTTPGETAFFAVSRPGLYESGLSDAYTLPLGDPTAIALARQLVSSGGGDLIVVAYVMKGADGVNRNWGAPGHPPWSWHVTEFLEFAEQTVEVCDGNPTFTEAESSNWADDEKIQICYWSYRVVEEVTALPVADSSWARIKGLY